MSRAILGIDPGLHGALARYWPETGRLQILDIPTLDVGKKGSRKLVVDEYALARLVDDWAGVVDCAWLEQVNAMPSIPGPDGERRSMGSASAFNFGRTYGLIRGILAANFLTIHDVAPVTWKRALKVTGDKDHARLRASALFPRHAELWPRKRDDGRAEAAMIALYGARRDDWARAA